MLPVNKEEHQQQIVKAGAYLDNLFKSDINPYYKNLWAGNFDRMCDVIEGKSPLILHSEYYSFYI